MKTLEGIKMGGSKHLPTTTLPRTGQILGYQTPTASLLALQRLTTESHSLCPLVKVSALEASGLPLPSLAGIIANKTNSTDNYK